jgi:hypothetical protein
MGDGNNLSTPVQPPRSEAQLEILDNEDAETVLDTPATVSKRLDQMFSPFSSRPDIRIRVMDTPHKDNIIDLFAYFISLDVSPIAPRRSNVWRESAYEAPSHALINPNINDMSLSRFEILSESVQMSLADPDERSVGEVNIMMDMFVKRYSELVRSGANLDEASKIFQKTTEMYAYKLNDLKVIDIQNAGSLPISAPVTNPVTATNPVTPSPKPRRVINLADVSPAQASSSSDAEKYWTEAAQMFGRGGGRGRLRPLNTTTISQPSIGAPAATPTRYSRRVLNQRGFGITKRRGGRLRDGKNGTSIGSEFGSYHCLLPLIRRNRIPPWTP